MTGSDDVVTGPDGVVVVCATARGSGLVAGISVQLDGSAIHGGEVVPPTFAGVFA